MRRDRALHLLAECRGDEIWSVPYCEIRGVPEAWIEADADAYESGFQFDRETIYVDHQPTNQYYGVRDVDLAKRLGAHLGIDIVRLAGQNISPQSLVRAIQQAIEEGD